MPDTITIQDLLNNHYRSTPRNKLLADSFKDLGLIEKYGSGIQRIINFFKVEHLPAPAFQNISDGFMVTVFAKDKKEVGEKVGEKVGEEVGENLSDNQERILQLLKSNKNISAQKIADEIGISQRKVAENIAKLKALSLLKPIGPAKSDHWEVKKKHPKNFNFHLQNIQT